MVTSNKNDEADKYKYNGKELEEELGKNTYAYGWRDYDPAIGRFNKVDRFAEKYYNLSTYSYAGNNPVIFVDIQGDSITAGSQAQFDRERGKVQDRRDKLSEKAAGINAKADEKGWSDEKRAKKLGNTQSRITSLDNTLQGLNDLEGSSQWYSLNKINSEETGGLVLGNDNVITINYSNTGNFVHETDHANQFENRDFGFVVGDGGTLGVDLQDEVSSYRAQFAYDPSSVSGINSSSRANSFNTITQNWVSGIIEPNGNLPYAQGGTSNTGRTPLSANSNRAAVIQAYPLLRDYLLGNMRQNSTLSTLPSVYFKN